MKVASCRCTGNSCSEDFQIPRGTTRRSLSLVKLKTSPAFLKIAPLIFSRSFAKSFEQLFLGKLFYLNVSPQEITDFTSVTSFNFL